MKAPELISSPNRNKLQKIAEDIYIYGYPLVFMDLTRRSQTATARPTLNSAPVNQFAHGHFVRGHQEKYVIRPNVDCLRSCAWLDLRKEPVVLAIPQTDRYYFLSFFSAWYEIFQARSPRTIGNHAEHIGFVASNWTGCLPAGVTPIVAPTETVWIDGWFAVDGAEDVELVRNLQSRFRLTPLSEWERAETPHSLPFRVDVDHRTTPLEQVARLDARAFYTRLSKLMQKNPPQARDAEVVAEFIRVGFPPADAFAFDTLEPLASQAMHRAIRAAQLRIRNAEKETGRARTANNWSLAVHPGHYGANYLDRAVAVRSGAAAVLAEDVLCFHTTFDHRGDIFRGSQRYVINFRPDLRPPVKAFWSITLYDSRQRLLQNSVHRNVIRDRDPLRLNPDKSVSIYIQHEWPGAADDYNWLPSPKDEFSLALRIYGPKPEALTGSWRPPAVIRTS